MSRSSKRIVPRAGALHAEDGADQRALAGAIGADDGDDLARRDIERHAVERLGVAVEEVEIAHRQHRAQPRLVVIAIVGAAPR